MTDYDQPNTYAANPDWPGCKALVEDEYRRMLGVKKVIWVPTGVVEDNGTFRGALAPHIHVQRLNDIDIPHAGVYTVFTTNGHVDNFVRFVAPETVVLARETVPKTPASSDAERLIRWMQERNHERLERVHDILAHETTESGEPIRIVRIPTPELTLDVFQPGDGTFDYWAEYERWEDGSSLPHHMLGVWASSYVNYVPTNGVVLVSKFWKPGRSLEILERDRQAQNVLKRLFPGRRIVPIHSENVNRGGGGMNCITQQEPRSSLLGADHPRARGSRNTKLFGRPRPLVLRQVRVAMNRSMLLLVGAVAFEVLWAVMLKLAGGFARPWASAVMAVAYVLSLVFLNLACRTLDISLAYAVWTGAGASVVALIGVVVFHEPLSLGRAIGFTLVIAGVVVLIGLEPRASSDGSFWRPSSS